MAYAGMAYGYGSGSYAPQRATMGNSVDQQMARNNQMQAHRQSADYEREMYERGLQMQEQRRRMYDSETARQAQDKRFSVLDGLTKRAFGGSSGPGGAGGGMQSWGFRVGKNGRETF